MRLASRPSVDHVNRGVHLVASSGERPQEGGGLAAVGGFPVDAAIADHLRIRRDHDSPWHSPGHRLGFLGGGPGHVAQRSERHRRALLDPGRDRSKGDARSPENIDPPRGCRREHDAGQRSPGGQSRSMRSTSAGATPQAIDSAGPTHPNAERGRSGDGASA